MPKGPDCPKGLEHQQLSWYRKAADQGNRDAEVRLANCYLSMGVGVETGRLKKPSTGTPQQPI
jgi:TPR repeat protein